ncbi:MAG: transposase [Chloroflexi bacterium]|nr:transposase [Chloroflexota bacterium]
MAAHRTAAHTARERGLDHIPPEIKTELVDQFRHGVLVGLKTVPRREHGEQLPARNLPERLRDRQADVLHFTEDLTIPFTNNQGERDLRMVKLQQKISGRLPSEQATQTPAPHPRLHLRRRQARHQHHDRTPRRHHRKPLDATNSRRHLNVYRLTTPVARRTVYATLYVPYPDRHTCSGGHHDRHQSRPPI